MLNCENIMLIGLVSIIVIIVVLMWQKKQTKSMLVPQYLNNS